MSASRIIVFNPDKSKYLVGKESYFITNIKDITNEMRHTFDILFTRQVNKVKDHNDSDEIKFYTKQLNILYKNNSIMKIIRKYSYSDRITFGDIKYKKINNHIYSYTIPQYVPRGSHYSFPGGQPSNSNTNISCAVRELWEETGINLKSKSYDIKRLIDSEEILNGYKLMYYILDENEYTNALNDIKRKNNSSQAELHDLRFIDIITKLSIDAKRNLKRVTRKIMKP